MVEVEDLFRGAGMKWLVAAALAAGAIGGVAGAQSSGGATAAPVPLIPAEAFGALPFMIDPEISPDGKRVVASSIVGGKSGAVLVDLARSDHGITRIGIAENQKLLWARWAGPDRVLMSLMVPRKIFGLELPTSRLVVYDRTTAKLSAIGEKVGGLDGDNVIHVDPAGAYILMSAQRTIFDYPAVLRVDLQTMDATQIVAPKTYVWNWYSDPKGVVRAGLGTEGNRWWLLYRETAEADFRKIARGKRPQAESLTDVEKLLPSAGSDKGYAIANKATGRYGVYRYDFVTDTIGDPIFEHPEVDVDSVGFSARTGEVDSVSYIDDRQRTAWLDPGMKAVQARIDRALPDSMNRIVSRDATDTRMIVWSSSPSDPGAYYLFDRVKKELRELVRPYSQLDEAKLAPMEAVRYAARDGLQVPAYLTLPAGRPAKGLPLIVMPHGGPFVRDSWAYEPWVQFLANRGYAVLQPNFRGSTGYGKAYVEAASGQFGRKMQDDLDDGVAWLAARGTVDPKRVCMMGASYGGYAALWAAVRNPDVYRCSVSFAGISDIPSMLRYDRSKFVATRYYRDWRDRIRGPEDFDLKNVSPINRAREIRVPMLIAHGEKDSTVPANQSKRLHEALRKAGIAHEYVTYPEEGHGFEKVENSVDFLKRVDAFLAKHNPAR